MLPELVMIDRVANSPGDMGEEMKDKLTPFPDGYGSSCVLVATLLVTVEVKPGEIGVFV